MNYLFQPSAIVPLRIAHRHDPNSKELITITYIPPAWQANTVYLINDVDAFDTAIPTTFTGFYHKVISPGKTGATEPTDWATTVGGQTTSGSVTFEAVAYNLLAITDTIATSTWAATDAVTLTTESNTTTTAAVRRDAIPAGVESFTLTNHTVMTSGQEFDQSLLIRVSNK